MRKRKKHKHDAISGHRALSSKKRIGRDLRQLFYKKNNNASENVKNMMKYFEVH